MKTFLFLLGLVAAGFVGYSFEPNLRFSLTGKRPENRDAKPAIVAATAAEPTLEPPAEIDLLEQLAAPAPVEPEIVIPPPPAPEPAPQPAPAALEQRSNVIALMQSSIKGGEIKEFTFSQVLDWQASQELETIEGETYQTGTASYKAETVFGVKTIRAKALIKAGKVMKWLWPKSGMEIQ